MGAFPTTDILDTFNRANENPLSAGGNWQTSDSAVNLQVVSNQCKGTTAGSAAAHRTDAYLSDIEDTEAYVTVVTVPADGDYVALYVHLRDATLSTWDGYRLVATKVAGGANDTMTVARIDNGALTVLGATITSEYAANHKLGLRASATSITVWQDSGSGWTSKGSRSDSTYPTGKLGLGVRGSTAVVDNFGGGPVNQGSIWTASDASSVYHFHGY